MAKVEVFYSKMCGACHDAMDYFTEQGVPFESFEVKWAGDDWADDENGRGFKQRFGDADTVPQIMIGERHVKGWKELSSLIERGELDDLLNAEP